MTSSRDDERRRVAGQTSPHILDPGRDFDPWHDYLQLGRLVNNPNNCSLGWAGRTSLSLDIEEDNGTPNCYKEEQEFDLNSVENNAFSPATSSRRSSLFSATAGRRSHGVSEETEEELDLNYVESIAFSPTTSSSSIFSDPAGRRSHCVSEEEEFDLNSVERTAFSPAISSWRNSPFSAFSPATSSWRNSPFSAFSPATSSWRNSPFSAFSPATSSRRSSLFSPTVVRRPPGVSEEEFDLNSAVESIALATSTSLFSDPAGRRPHCVSEEEFDLNSVESDAFSPATSTSLFSSTAGGRSRCVSEESMSSVSDTAQAAARRRRPGRFSVETPTSPSSASSVSDTVGVVGAGGGGARRRPPLPACCRFCKQNGESAEIYLSHSLRCEDGRVTCPILRRYSCPTCNATGDNAHTRRYCPLAQVGGTGGGHGEQMPAVLPETGGALPLWVLDCTRAFQFEN